MKNEKKYFNISINVKEEGKKLGECKQLAFFRNILKEDVINVALGLFSYNNEKHIAWIWSHSLGESYEFEIGNGTRIADIEEFLAK